MPPRTPTSPAFLAAVTSRTPTTPRATRSSSLVRRRHHRYLDEDPRRHVRPGRRAGALPLTVGNNGTGPTTAAITLRDQLPAGLLPTAASGSDWNCGIQSSLVTCTRTAPLAPQETSTVTLTVNVASTATGVVRNDRDRERGRRLERLDCLGLGGNRRAAAADDHQVACRSRCCRGRRACSSS